MRYATLNHITFVCIGLLLVACAEDVSQEELIEVAVEMRVEQWTKQQLIACKEKAITRAEDTVDSILVAISLPTKLDTIPKPGKPLRPDKPEFKEKPDSLKVRKNTPEEIQE